MQILKISPLFLAALALFVPACYAQNAPKIAVFDPQGGTREGRFKLDLPFYNQVADTLEDAGMSVARVSSDGLNDANAFDAKKFDALFLQGDSFPKANIKSLQKFADEGGILVALGANVPFLVQTAQNPEGTWTMEPKSPNFAWQSNAILGYFNAKFIYNEAMHDAGVLNTPTPLLKKYLPEAPSINEKMPARFVVPFDGGGRSGEFFPLLRSQRVDGQDVTPQIYVMRSGKRMAIVASNAFLTKGDDPRWPLGQKTVVALARLAHDLRANPGLLTPDLKIALSEDVPLPEPLRTRLASGEVNPEGAKPLVRWGKFDGTSSELGEILRSAQSREVALNTPSNQIPRALEGGATLKLALPNLPANAQKWLRVRGGFGATGAGLRAQIGEQTLWNETFEYIDAGGAGNFSAPNIANVPAEFHRIIFLAPDVSGQTLTLHNPGKKPVYFDAIQIETRSAPAPEMIMGLGMGQRASYPNNPSPIAPEITNSWTAIRAVSRLQFVGDPSKPDRWKDVDELLGRATAMNSRVHLILEGTPEWAAISPERYKQAGNRKSTTAPDPAKFAPIVEHVIRKYGDKIEAYELWNEADSQQFFRGTTQEYITLYKTLLPIIKRLDPTAKIITTGMAGFKEEFVADLDKAGALQSADWFGFHPYAGKSPAWDVPFGMVEGSLYSKGQGMEIYCNESGFVWKPAEWFTAPPRYTEVIQRDLLDVAMARLLSNGLAKLNVFHAGGDTHEFGLMNQKGEPRLAYGVFADYLPLGQNGGRRLDVSLVGEGDVPLQGVYVAAASHSDGSVTAVINAAQSPFFARQVTLRVPLSKEGNYKATLRQNGQNGPVLMEQKTASGQSWASVKINLQSRAVLTISP